MDLNTISAETLAELVELRKAATGGVVASTGLYGYDLAGVVSLVPVNTPTYDLTPREDGDGSAAAHWRTLLNVNNTQPNPFTGLDGGGSLVNVSEIDVLAPYLPVRLSGKVTRDAVALAKNYADAKAIASLQTLMQWRIQDNKAIIGGQAYALPAIGQPAFTTATTGGTIPASTTVHIRVAARSAYNYYWGGSGAASTDASQATGAGTSTNTITATWTPVKGAVAYDVYVAGFYYTTVTAPTVTVTSVPVANQSIPTTLPGLYGTAPTSVPATDTSYSANSYNGKIASILGDYTSNGPLVTPGSGTGSGATWVDLGGAALSGTSQGVTQIDNMNSLIYNAAQLSVTRLTANARVAQEIGSASLGSNAAVTYLMTSDSDRTGVTVGVQAARYINRITGESLEITVDPWIPDGMAIFQADTIPYPDAGIANNFAVRTLQEVSQFDYGVSLVPGANGGPAEVWDQSSIETVLCRAPVACGVMTGIG